MGGVTTWLGVWSLLPRSVCDITEGWITTVCCSTGFLKVNWNDFSVIRDLQQSNTSTKQSTSTPLSFHWKKQTYIQDTVNPFSLITQQLFTAASCWQLLSFILFLFLVSFITAVVVNVRPSLSWTPAFKGFIAFSLPLDGGLFLYRVHPFFCARFYFSHSVLL